VSSLRIRSLLPGGPELIQLGVVLAFEAGPEARVGPEYDARRLLLLLGRGKRDRYRSENARGCGENKSVDGLSISLQSSSDEGVSSAPELVRGPGGRASDRRRLDGACAGGCSLSSAWLGWADDSRAVDEAEDSA